MSRRRTAVPAVNELTRRTITVLAGKNLNEQAGNRLAHSLWTTIYARELSERQIEVLRLMARGHSMKQIGQQLTISEKTVDNHIQHIYNKIGVSTRAAAVFYALEHELI